MAYDTDKLTSLIKLVWNPYHGKEESWVAGGRGHRVTKPRAILDLVGGNARIHCGLDGKVRSATLPVRAGYAEGLPSILKGLNFHADMNQRVGIVGRAGAGKSALSPALFRFLEACKGASLSTDGVGITHIARILSSIARPLHSSREFSLLLSETTAQIYQD
ncbi:hypothetical protein B0O99DRAFT_733107 [Bisporella sp. PMI_857]|nr:hypothetical protein B0O99DRAFT_733107 [Bisporella sp. PMI_857]